MSNHLFNQILFGNKLLSCILNRISKFQRNQNNSQEIQYEPLEQDKVQAPAVMLINDLF